MKKYVKPSIYARNIKPATLMSGSTSLLGLGVGEDATSGTTVRSKLTSRDLFNLNYNGIELVDDDELYDE